MPLSLSACVCVSSDREEERSERNHICMHVCMKNSHSTCCRPHCMPASQHHRSPGPGERN